MHCPHLTLDNFVSRPDLCSNSVCIAGSFICAHDFWLSLKQLQKCVLYSRVGEKLPLLVVLGLAWHLVSYCGILWVLFNNSIHFKVVVPAIWEFLYGTRVKSTYSVLALCVFQIQFFSCEI